MKLIKYELSYAKKTVISVAVQFAKTLGDIVLVMTKLFYFFKINNQLLLNLSFTVLTIAFCMLQLQVVN